MGIVLSSCLVVDVNKMTMVQPVRSKLLYDKKKNLESCEFVDFIRVKGGGKEITEAYKNWACG